LNEVRLFFKKAFRLLLLLLLAFVAGGFFTGFFIYKQRPGNIGELDNRYNFEYGRATEIIGRLESELERERDLNRQLREHNARARELTEGLADTTERNGRNLQDAVSLIGEIRTKLKVLEDFYSSSDSGNSAGQR
jgi:hypothetical protein